MKSWVVAAVLAASMVAGCADANSAQGPNTLADAEQAAAELDVQATKTTGVIRGIVIDEALRPLGGVLITVTNMDINATSSTEGAFAFEGLEAGTYFLQASLADYTTVQQSADVVAGVDNPEAIKILLAAIPRETPFIEALQAHIFVSGSGWVAGVGGVTVGGGGVLGNGGNWQFERAIQVNGTVAQTELTWDPTSPLGENGRGSGGTYNDNDAVDTETKTGPSPMIFLANATEGDETADNVYYSFYAWPSAGTPVGFAFNQQVNAFIHVFHNFRPNEGWQFGRDGEHPVPGG